MLLQGNFGAGDLEGLDLCGASAPSGGNVRCAWIWFWGCLLTIKGVGLYTLRELIWYVTLRVSWRLRVITSIHHGLPGVLHPGELASLPLFH